MKLEYIKPGTHLYKLATTNKRYRNSWAERFGLTIQQVNDMWPWKRVVVPRPPKLDVSPASDKAVVTVVVGHEAKTCFSVSGEHMQAYADRIGADFVVLSWPGHKDWPMSCKYAVARVLDVYERIIYLDADVLVSPTSPDLFQLVGSDEFGGVDELAFHLTNEDDVTVQNYRSTRYCLGYSDLEPPWYINAGVVVVPRSLQWLLEPPECPVPVDHCTEQDLLNIRLLEEGVPVKFLDKMCNWHTVSGDAPEGAILHFSHSVEGRREDMASFAKPLVYEFDPLKVIQWPDHDWYIDLRHLRWLHSVLMSGRFSRVLEIGCHHGWSATAFLDALKAGKVQEVHLCDTKITPELKSVIDKYGVSPTIHNCPSLDILDQSWDLVFLDGDHSVETVLSETPWLLSTRSVFAHDTGSAKMFKGCEGPQHLKQAFQLAGRRCLEDAVLRSNERTDRGMFFSTTDETDFQVALNGMRRWCR
jgi:hypothetical protein